MERAAPIFELERHDGDDQRRRVVGEDGVVEDLGGVQGATLGAEPSPGREELEEETLIENRRSPSLTHELEPIEVVWAEGQEVRQLPNPRKPLSPQKLHGEHTLVLGEI
jgi:hypothetical protein